MAVTFLKKESIANFEIWENTPRLPQHIQTILAELDAEDKLKEAWYRKSEQIVNVEETKKNALAKLNGIEKMILDLD